MTHLLTWWAQVKRRWLLRRMERDAKKVEAYWEKNAYKHWLA